MTTSPVMSLLEAGIPLSLICDLVSTSAPDSIAINSMERPGGDPIWRDAASDVATAWQHAASE